MQYDDITTNPLWLTDAMLKIVFRLYLDYSTPIVQLTRNLEWGSRITLGDSYTTEMVNFENSRWRTAAILKMVTRSYHEISIKFVVHVCTWVLSSEQFFNSRTRPIYLCKCPHMASSCLENGLDILMVWITGKLIIKQHINVKKRC